MATNRDSPIFRTTQNAAAPFKIQDISIQHGHPLVQHAYSWPLAHADCMKHAQDDVTSAMPELPTNLQPFELEA